jgi:hypothetical protein
MGNLGGLEKKLGWDFGVGVGVGIKKLGKKMDYSSKNLISKVN